MTDLAPTTSPGEDFAVVAEQIAPGISAPELVYFARVCRQLDLSYFRGEITPIGRYDKRVDRTVYRPQITVDGRLTLARRTGDLVGIDGPVWCGPRNNGGDLVWRDVWDGDGYPYCARVLVHVKGWDRPVNGTAKWDEFAQKDRLGNLTGLWPTMPSHMLGKVALSMALRRGFAGVIAVAVDAGFDGDDVDLAPPALPPPAGEVDPFTSDRPLVDTNLRRALLEQAENLAAADRPASNWLKREWDILGGPKLSGDAPMTRIEGELYRRLLNDAPFAVGQARPDFNPQAWSGEQTPADVLDDAPEAVQHLEDDAYRMDPPA